MKLSSGGRIALVLASVVIGSLRADDSVTDADFVREHYTKFEYRIPMRDGVRLFTAVYSPAKPRAARPILMLRTPYSCRPYGADRYPEQLGPDMRFARAGYIFVIQDVRGRYMSEGEFVDMTPHRAEKSSPSDIDESTDTRDTIDWLLANIPGHNGRVGQWGISYPGFYAAAGMIDTHPALRAVSPQAPIADWYFDDFHHHGAFFLPHAFNFLATFGKPRPEPTTKGRPRFDHGTPDGYQFFLDLGPLKNAQERLGGDVAFWDAMAAHPNYDEFWKEKDLLPHLDGVRCAVMTVGGWFDAEDLYGPLKIYRSIEEKNPGIFNVLVMGPWDHGGWSRGAGDRLGRVNFGTATSEFFRQEMQFRFFEHFLEKDGSIDLPEAWVFETGAQRWRTFPTWPPQGLLERRYWLRERGGLSLESPEGGDSDSAPYDEFISDPARPVPFTEDIATGMTREYMTDDQRFAARRPDVLVYRTPVLDDDTTFAGPIIADLLVSTSESDADWIVKVIDVFPDDAPDPEPNPEGVRRGAYQMLVRSEVIRGRFRESYEAPEPFEPGVPARVRLELQDVLHTFLRGHRIMVQIQSTWFPLVDRNPQRYVENIFEANEDDFVRATHRVYRSAERDSVVGSHIIVGTLVPPDAPRPEE
jgi:putative CocE/NonD family hydrolase